ncbi:alpha/beta hydrolase [Actinospica robiniae]|uniref:alpha/beta hydrolase n=1 Tax=Actinospica robiniae TaxID=304901 RepID=UPI00041BE3C7|nr:alpha/beta hydrolase [Actinospica robiniae]
MPLHPEAPAARTDDLADGLRRAGAGAPEAVGAVLERMIPGPARNDLPVRVYEPRSVEPPAATALAERRRPALVYFFGGGWTAGNLETSDGICRALTNAAHCVTVSVRYRLAPEFPFPAAVEDCHAATCWVAEHAAELGVDPARIAVGGDGAGGNLAAAVALLARDTGPALRHQLLVCPHIDPAADTASLREHDDPSAVNRRPVAWHWEQYLAKPEDGESPLASPLRAETLAGLPGATVITAEFDPLRDEGEQYALMLLASGVPVDVHRYNAVPHGFFAMPGVYRLGREAQAYAAACLAAAFEAADTAAANPSA